MGWMDEGARMPSNRSTKKKKGRGQKTRDQGPQKSRVNVGGAEVASGDQSEADFSPSGPASSDAPEPSSGNDHDGEV